MAIRMSKKNKAQQKKKLAKALHAADMYVAGLGGFMSLSVKRGDKIQMGIYAVLRLILAELEEGSEDA